MSKKPEEVSDPRFLRLLKGGKSSKKKNAPKDGEDLFNNSSQEPSTPDVDPNSDSLLLLAELDEEIQNWIHRKTSQPDFAPAIRLFNLFNLEKNPESGLAKQLTLTVLKGTSFPDKRDTCIEFIQQIRQGQHTGELNLVTIPYEDPRDPSRNDPWAMKAIPKGWHEDNFLGYIPKAQGLNETFGKAIEAGIFCGCHMMAAKHTLFQGNDNQILTVACGWKTPKPTPEND